MLQRHEATRQGPSYKADPALDLQTKRAGKNPTSETKRHDRKPRCQQTESLQL